MKYIIALLLLCSELLGPVARAQNVGIGTTTPTQKLDVNGGLRVQGLQGAGAGRLLSVTADGTLQAQSAPFGATASTSPQPPAILNTFSLGYALSNIAVNAADTRAYVANGILNTPLIIDLTNVVFSGPGLTVPEGFTGVAVNAAGTRAYVTSIFTNSLQTFDLTSGTPVRLNRAVIGSGPRGVAVNAAGTRAYVVSDNNTLQTFDLTSGTPVSLGTPVPTGSGPRGVAVNAAGTRAYVVNFSANTLQAYDLTSGTPAILGPPVPTGGGPAGVAVNAAGTRAYVVNESAYTLQTFVIGSPPRLVAVGGDGSLGSVDPATLSGDNLGNHTAIQNLNLATYQLVGNGGSQGLSISSAGRVGVGTSSPVAQLEVDLPSFSAAVSLKLEHRGSNILFHPLNAGGSASVIENTAGNLLLNPSGSSIGIGTSTPSYTLDVAGTIRGNNVSPSDARFKTNVRPLGGALASVLALRGVRYEWNALGVQHGGRAGASQVGLLAQELEQLYPELVSTDIEGYKAVNYAQLTPVLLEAIKELAAQNATLRARLSQQQQTQQASATGFELRLRALEAALPTASK